MINRLPQPVIPPLRQRGLTLIELMVALSLGAFLVLGVVNVFVSSKKSSQVEYALARVQENGRFALDVLSDDIRRAHYSGCNSVANSVTTIAQNVSYTGIRGSSLSGGTWSPALDPNDPVLATLDTGSVRDGTDILNIHMAEHVGDDLLAADVTPTGSTIRLTSNPDCAIEPNSVVIVSNCLTSHVLRVSPTPAACSSDLAITAAKNRSLPIEPGYRYDGRSEIMLFQSIAWYVADTGRDRNGYDVYALYRKSMSTPAQEMIEGVEHMQLLYGQRGGTTGIPSTRFVTADDASLDWSQVVSVRIGLLIQSYELVRSQDDALSYVLADPNSPITGDPNTPGGHSSGRALRQAFRTTTVLRNTDYDT